MAFLKNIKSFFVKSKKEKKYEAFNNIEKLNQFLNQDSFISVKEKNLFLEEIEGFLFLEEFNNEENLIKYCNQNNYDVLVVNEYLEKLKDIDSLVKKHNNEFVDKHLNIDCEYFDKLFSKVDSKIILDKEQRKVVLHDEDYTLVIAGAGAGKTTTVAAKVKYLVEKKNINPEDILIVSFTNKAVGELKERINRDLNINCKISTFHSIGYSIINEKNKEKFPIASSDKLYKWINEFLVGVIEFNEDLAKKLVLFFSYYMNIDENAQSIEDLKKVREFTYYETLKSQLEEENLKEIEERKSKKITINYERVRSIEEVKVANFLYLNGINYEYERPYPYYIPGLRRPYRPDFTIFNGDEIIYLEHFGVTENHESTLYSKEVLDKYLWNIDLKKRTHRRKGTKLIYTYSSYNDGIDLLEHLKELLINNGVELNPRDTKEIYKQLVKTGNNQSFARLVKLLMSFIGNFKTNGWDLEDFDRLMNNSKSERDKVFLEIAKEAYIYYQSKLKENHQKDFQDLINESKKILDEVAEMKEKLSYKYIIVDEYQDISLQRFNLTKRLSEVTDAKIIAVGDDWQSIYAFAGSKINLFTEFEKMMGYADLLEITHTYRNSQELIDIAGKFIQKNNMQYKKKLESPKSIKYPIAIFSYSDDYNANKTKGKSGVLKEKAVALEKALDAIVKRNNKQDLKVLLIGRFGFEGEKFARTELFDYVENEKGKKRIVSKKYPKLDIEYMTAHSSKGLGRDEVIIINSESGNFGFPSEKTNDPVLNMVIYNDKSYEDAEERRLFYVALTRTKNRVYILAPKYTPSKFLLEIKDEENVYKDYEFNEVKEVNKKLGIYCPHCGFPIHYKESKAFGRKMYICSNDTEICGFVSNNMKGGKTSIKKCPVCKDGYLFIKKIKNVEKYFLGCSNFDNDRSCRYTEELDEDKGE